MVSCQSFSEEVREERVWAEPCGSLSRGTTGATGVGRVEEEAVLSRSIDWATSAAAGGAEIDEAVMGVLMEDGFG